MESENYSTMSIIKKEITSLNEEITVKEELFDETVDEPVKGLFKLEDIKTELAFKEEPKGEIETDISSIDPLKCEIDTSEEEVYNQDIVQSGTSHTVFLCDQNYDESSEPKTKPKSTGKKSYKCEVCEKSFISSSKLTCHVRTHTGEKPVECQVCEKKFGTRSQLNRHIRTHTGEKPFECEICKRKFPENCKLVNHMRSHTEEKPFECEVCKKRFRRRGELRQHIQTHSGEKPVECKICHKRLTKNGLKHHILTHNEEKIFECDICKREFKYHSKLISHMQFHNKYFQEKSSIKYENPF